VTFTQHSFLKVVSEGIKQGYCFFLFQC